MPKIFLSYRREDSVDIAAQIYDRLTAQYGRDSVFMELDVIASGVDFRRYLTEAASEFDVFLAIIGEQWLTFSKNGRPRLEDAEDFVRIEIEIALKGGIPVVPVLVGGVSMPREDQLPWVLKELAFRNAATVDPGRDFHIHVDRLIRDLDHLVAKPKPVEPAEIRCDRGVDDSEPAGRHQKTSRSVPTDAYTGGEPFLFVSYCHRDRDIVYPEIVRLQNKGFRIWYDEGITPGKEWPEEIEDALSRAASFVVFVSPRAMSSENVRNEINYALRRKKPFLAIHIEETELVKGMALQMEPRQAIFRYALDHSSYTRRVDEILPAKSCSDGQAAKSKPVEPAEITKPQNSAPKAQSSPKRGQLITNAVGMRFAWVPPGASWLGGGGNKPGTTPFTLKQGLWCGVYPVTQADWQQVMGSNPSQFKGNPRYPVESVSWNDVQIYLEELNSRAGGYSYRLPTEQEWEYICRGGPIPPDQSKYHFYFAKSKADLTPKPTDNLSSREANFDGEYPAGFANEGPNLQQPTEVGIYLRNPLGIFDMHGNLWEWTDSMEGSDRVLRGGCWKDYALSCTASDRLRREPDEPYNYVGFRILAVPSGNE
jgi:formylglycine-generating enzyme required for sulfatase activity